MHQVLTPTSGSAIAPAANVAAKTAAARRWVVAGVIVLLFVLPWIVSDYRVFQLTLAFSYWIALFGLNLLIGYNGQASLGHGAFYAIGAYAAVILVNNLAIPYWLSLPLAGAVCFVSGVAFGLPSLRLAGHYLGLATFALALAVPQLLKFKPLEPWTGGVQGIPVPKPDSPSFLAETLGLPLDAERWLYYLTLVIALAGVALGRNMIQSRVGRAIVSIREHPIASSAMGINAAYYKTVTFGISAMYTGIGGALSAFAVGHIAPDSFTFFLSISFIIGVTIGGNASIAGPFIGALFIQFVPNFADEISKAAPWAIYGVTLIAVVYLMPDGVIGAADRRLAAIVAWWNRRRGPRPVSPPSGPRP